MSTPNPDPRADQRSADVSMDVGLQEASASLPKLTHLNNPPKEVEAIEPDAGLQETTPNISEHTWVSESQKKEVEVDRFAYIKKKLEENQMKLAEDTRKSHLLAVERKYLGKTDDGKTTDNLLTMRTKQAIDMQNGVGDVSISQKGKHASVVLIKHGIAVKSSVQPITLPKVEKIPPYTTWVYTHRNERMREDQSVLGRKRLYYDTKEGETLICSDSEEENTDNDNNKKEFRSADKTRSATEQTGSSNSVCDSSAQHLSRRSCEIMKERYKDLEAAQSSINKIFCRRCLIFGCKLHGCSQQLIYPAEQKSSTWNMDDENVPCGQYCYLKMEANAGIHVHDVTPTNSSTPSNKEKSARKSTETAESSSSSPKAQNLSRKYFESWGTLEKSLLKKGIEIFGRKSCLIATNLMNQQKTCSEVYHALQYQWDNSSDECNENMGTRRVRSDATSSQISEKDLEERRQYNPCACQSSCGDDCSCLKNGTVCEKFCGCPKTCKNRYRGCYCAKSKCRTRQCPCFASNRECDPDVCRHCWISCDHDGTLGSPYNEGNFECENMKILLKQGKQKVLLGRSKVAGWGVFLRNDVDKDEYLGEYTGELISHREADKRGKVYDREDCSYLFNLNDQYVVDGKRIGSKLKFINHSHKPNCSLQVIKVAGDHRVGVFAKKKICAGEELFCDYCYEDDNAPSWAKKPEDNDSKETDDTAASRKRAKKLS